MYMKQVNNSFYSTEYCRTADIKNNKKNILTADRIQAGKSAHMNFKYIYFRNYTIHIDRFELLRINELKKKKNVRSTTVEKNDKNNITLTALTIILVFI